MASRVRWLLDWLGAMPIEARCLLLSLAAGGPAVVVSLVLLAGADLSFPKKWGIGLTILICWLGCAWRVRSAIHSPFFLMAGVLRSFTEGDYSVRLAVPRSSGVLGDMASAVNDLGSTLRSQRLGATEASLLLRSVTDEIDVAIFTLSPVECLTWTNRAGERLIGRPRASALGESIRSLGLTALLEPGPDQLVEFPQLPGKRWDIRRKAFHEGGVQQTMLVVSDLTKPLQREERAAWQRLIRVLSHEINNSLTPIQSLSACLVEMLDAEDKTEDWQSDFRSALTMVADRSGALSRFISSYARLANLPPPRKIRVALRDLVRNVAALERRTSVIVKSETNPILLADPDQIEQVLINLIKNAAEASLESGGAVDIFWRMEPDAVHLFVRDEGAGLFDTLNLFVPYYTTKPGGSGIGLALSRSIMEAHGGSLQLRNRPDRTGCEASIRIPL
jgi:two-component system, NtrC family, nitrogen regulation sensor histidine kinase NtrY